MLQLGAETAELATKKPSLRAFTAR